MSSTDDATAVQVMRVVDSVRDAIGAEGGALMLLGSGGALRVMGTSGAAVALLEQAQADHGDGPGFEAVRTAAPVLVDDLAASPWADLLAEGGGELRAVLSVPITAGDVVAGNLNLLRDRRHTWSDEEVARAAAAATTIASLLQAAAAAEGARAGVLAPEVLGGLAGDADGSGR